MLQYSYEYVVQSPFYSPDRLHQALVIIRTAENKILLAEKKGYYPDGIYRFFGGRVDQGEDVIKAAVRELSEELKIQVTEDDVLPVAHIESKMQIGSETQVMVTDLYSYKLKGEAISVGDDVSGYKIMTIEEFKELIERMYALKGELSGVTKGKEVRFQWSDWGKVNGKIHEIGWEWVKSTRKDG